SRTAGTLLRALDLEKDDEVQAAFLLALGRLASTEAVQRLARTAEPERGLFKRKTTALRVAAVQGLAEARTPDAQQALRSLSDDRDEDVRTAAVFALGRIARQSASMERPTLE
ncbi:MAG: HEAT repeat domain-containing protein, partial [Gemmatimonadaceae bacterium]|nr:HEAT repeat domain-containing protein [Gemmatimonadaceae bacterium]